VTVAAGAVRTVLGDVSAAGFALVSPHEHLIADSRVWYSPHPGLSLAENPLGSLENLILDDEGIQSEELSEFADSAGLVVECTPHGMGRDLPALRRLASALAGRVAIVAGSGWYVEAAVDARLLRLGIDELTAELERDLAEGVDGILPGLIGEIGTGSPMTAAEERFVRAAARAQRSSGLAIQIHVDGAGREGLRILEAMRDEGADLGSVSLSHMDDALDSAYHLALLESGCYLEFDAFGADWNIPGAHVARDAERVEAIGVLASEGHAAQLLVAQDVWLRQRLRRGGGAGYGHLRRGVVPALISAGLDPDLVCRRNPIRLLTPRPG
jgi:phosphotriesterase-related protein